jgi:hypothetical protein
VTPGDLVPDVSQLEIGGNIDQDTLLRRFRAHNVWRRGRAVHLGQTAVGRAGALGDGEPEAVCERFVEERRHLVVGPALARHEIHLTASHRSSWYTSHTSG